MSVHRIPRAHLLSSRSLLMPRMLCARGHCFSAVHFRRKLHNAARHKQAARSIGQGIQGGYVSATPQADPDENASLVDKYISARQQQKERIGAGESTWQEERNVGRTYSCSQSEPQVSSEDRPSAEELKAMLLDSFYGSDRGLSASTELRGEISELISQLEAANPHADANDAGLLDGTWKLVYTAGSELGALLALSRLPFVTVGDITQTVNVATGKVVNKVVLSDAFTQSAFSSTADVEVRSPKLLSVRFVSGALATPQLLQDIDLPEYITVLGQKVDLRNLRDALIPARRSLRSAVSQVSAFLQQQPDTSIRIPEQVQAESWLLNTYIDEDVRIARGDGGAVFVMVKEAESVPTSSPVSGGFGTYGSGAWKDDPIGNRPPSEPPLTVSPTDPPLTGSATTALPVQSVTSQTWEPEPPSQEAALPPQEAPQPPGVQNPTTSNQIGLSDLSNQGPSQPITPTSLTAGGNDSSAERFNPSKTLGTSLGQRFARGSGNKKPNSEPFDS